MLSLYLRNLLFTILQPGLVAGLIPLWITGFQLNEICGVTWLWHRYFAALLFLIGFGIMLWSIISFAVKGRGTLSPADPTKKLVVTGLYKFSRNPMYLGVVLMLIAEALFMRSTELWIYALLVFIVFNMFTLFFEEPRLRRDFGAEYRRYCEKVRRWI